MRNRFLQEIGNKLKKLRKQIGCDRKGMAARLQVTPSAYYKNECGINFPSMNILKLLSDNSKISMDWFFFNKGSMYLEEKSKKETDLEQAVKKLTAELEQTEEKLTAEWDKERKKLEEACKKQGEVVPEPEKTTGADRKR